MILKRTFYHLVKMVVLGLPYLLSGQNEADVLRYSLQSYGGTARSYGLGGAFGSVGADFSCAGINPAGLARFRSSQFTFSTAFYNATNNSVYISNELTDKKFNFNLPNVSLLVNIAGEDFESKKPKGFVNFTLGFNMNRLNNFHSNTLFDAVNQSSSITQNWAERANATNTTPSNFSSYSLEHLAYQAWLIDKDTSSSTPRYKSAYGANPLINVRQYGNIMTKGAINDYNLSFAANYQHMVYFGLTLGAKSVRYIKTSDFIEEDKKTANVKDINYLTFNEYQRTTGTGLNAKLGINIAPNEHLRIGYAFHSPTVYNLKDTYSYSITSVFDYGAVDQFGDTRQGQKATTPQSTYYKYKISTPARNIFSISLVDKKIGFIAFDIETVNYTSGKIIPTKENAGDYSFTNENLNVRKFYNASAVNYRFGAEYVYDQYRFRCGYAKNGSPYKNNAFTYASDFKSNVYSLGFGIKTKDYSFDFAFVKTKSFSVDVPYTLESGKSAAITNNYNITNLVFSVAVPID